MMRRERDALQKLLNQMRHQIGSPEKLDQAQSLAAVPTLQTEAVPSFEQMHAYIKIDGGYAKFDWAGFVTRVLQKAEATVFTVRQQGGTYEIRRTNTRDYLSYGAINKDIKTWNESGFHWVFKDGRLYHQEFPNQTMTSHENGFFYLVDGIGYNPAEVEFESIDASKQSSSPLGQLLHFSKDEQISQIGWPSFGARISAASIGIVLMLALAVKTVADSRSFLTGVVMGILLAFGPCYMLRPAPMHVLQNRKPSKSLATQSASPPAPRVSIARRDRCLSAPLDVPCQVTETCLTAVETMLLSDVLECLEGFVGIVSALPGGSALSLVYSSQVASVRASPDLSSTVKQALENELQRGVHEGFTPKGQMNPKTVACELFWTMLAFRWGIASVQGMRSGLFIGVACGNAYPDTFEPHHGFVLRRAFKAAFSFQSATPSDALVGKFEGMEVVAVSNLCDKVEACYDELGLFDKRLV
jgi:hypothetical protein